MFLSISEWLPAVAMILVVFVVAPVFIVVGIVKAIEFAKAQESEKLTGALTVAATCLFGVVAFTAYWIKEYKRMKELRKQQQEGSVRHNIIG
jgi:uncharacterized membrane protein HdeD (DUF308 family)